MADQVKFELIDYRQRRRPRSTGSCRSACSNMSARRIMTNSSPSAASCWPRRGDAAPHHRQVRQGAARPTRSPTNRSSPAIICRRCRQMTAASEKVRLIASDVETLRLHYAYTLRALARARDGGARADRRDVRRALLPHVGILSRRRRSSCSRAARRAITRCNISATAARCRSRATIWPRRRAVPASRRRSRQGRLTICLELGDQRRRRIDRLQRFLDRGGRDRDDARRSSGHSHKLPQAVDVAVEAAPITPALAVDHRRARIAADDVVGGDEIVAPPCGRSPCAWRANAGGRSNGSAPVARSKVPPKRVRSRTLRPRSVQPATLP